MPAPKPVIQLDGETGEEIRRFNSAREAGWKCKIHHSAIMDNCHHRTKISGKNHFKKWVFMWLEEYNIGIRP